MNITQRKPFKLVSQDQQIKKGITAGSLDELTNKARQLFNFGSDVPLNVFEEDGTEVTSNEYMLFLEKFTKLVMVPEEQTESPAITENNHPESINKSYTLIKFLKKFVNKPEFMSLLSPDELNAVTTFTEDQPTDGVAEDDNSVEIENPISITNESQDWDWDWDLRELSQRWRHQEEFSEDGSCSNEYHQEKVHFVEVHRSITSMSGSDHCFCRFHPTLPVLVCGFNRVFLLNAENWSVPFSEWKEKEIKFEGQGLKTITIFEWNFDGTQLAAGCQDDTVIVWSRFPTGDVLSHTNRDFKWVHLIVWNPVRPDIFATLDKGSKKVLFWNSAIHDGKSNVFYTFEHEMKITLVEWTTENQVAIGFMNGLIEIWKMDENESKFLTKFKISDDALFGLEWSNVTKYLASCSIGEEGWISIWSLDSGTKSQPVYSEKYDHGFSSLAWLPASDKDNCGIDSARKAPENFILACGCTDKSIRIWNPVEKDDTKMHRILCGHSGPISCLSFSPDGRYLASASRNDKVIIWSTETWIPIFTTKMESIGSFMHIRTVLSWLSTNDSCSCSNYKLAISSRNDKIVVIEAATELDDNY